MLLQVTVFAQWVVGFNYLNAILIGVKNFNTTNYIWDTNNINVCFQLFGNVTQRPIVTSFLQTSL